MNRQTATKISREVERFLEKEGESTKRSEEAVQEAVTRTLARLQQHIALDLDEIARQAGNELATELQRGLFELANNNWYDHHAQDMMIVPMNTRFVHRHGTKVFIAIEEPADVRTIVYNDGVRDTKYRIGVPYCIFIFPVGTFTDDNGVTRYKLDGGRLGMTKKPLTSLDQMIYYPSVPNIDTSHGGVDGMKICMGRNYHPDPKLSLSAQVEHYITYFWNAPFGTDWAHEFERMGNTDPRFKSFQTWAKTTEDDALFTLRDDVKFREAGRFGNLIASSLGQENKINVPLKRMVKRAVDKLAEQVILKLRQADLGEEYKEKFVAEAVYKVVCASVRHCASELSDDIVVAEKQKLAVERTKLEDGLSELLIELEKKVRPGDDGRGGNYWWGR